VFGHFLIIGKSLRGRLYKPWFGIVIEIYTNTLKMIPRNINLPTKRLLVLSDLHLDKASLTEKRHFFKKLQNYDSDTVLITGDISVAGKLSEHLEEISDACGNRPVIFVTGNHDYYASSFLEVDREIKTLCLKQSNLIALGRGEIVELSKSTALVGHRGWYDGLAGSSSKTRIDCPDRYGIADFKYLSRAAFFRKLEQLGKESAEYFRQLLPYALTKYKNVLLATHVPPFTQGLRYDGKGCVWNKQPYFANRSLGNLIWGISKRFPDRQIQIYAGHTHSAASVQIRQNISLDVAGAKPGKPSIGKLLIIENFDTTAKKMDKIIQRRLPDGIITDGILRGAEPEIRQDALIMSLGGFLQKSIDYQNSYRKRDKQAQHSSMEKCAAITLRICKMRMKSLLANSKVKKVEFDDTTLGECCHPFQISPTEWPADLKATVIMRAAGKAVLEGKLSIANASIVSMVSVQCLKVQEIADLRKISRSAAYQQIQRVRRVLPKIIEEIDVCE